MGCLDEGSLFYIMKNTFSKKEKLCSEIRFKALFANGESFLIYPYRVSFMQNEQVSPAPVQIAFGVPKKIFKRAVKRNYIKRRMRECYRLQKNDLLTFIESKNITISVFIAFIAKEVVDYEVLDKKMKAVLYRINLELQKKLPSDSISSEVVE